MMNESLPPSRDIRKDLPEPRPELPLEEVDDFAVARVRYPHDKEEKLATPEDFLAPVDVNPWAILAGYASLFGLFPLLGIPFAVVAILLGATALSTPAPPGATAYARWMGPVRAWVAIWMGVAGLGFSALTWLVLTDLDRWLG
jgi:hypothetical protein